MLSTYLLSFLGLGSLALGHGNAFGKGKSKCANIRLPRFKEFRIVDSWAEEVRGYSSYGVSGLNFCNLTVAITHDNAGDYVYAYIWLPLEGWNGRFLATGGGGLVAGSDTNLPVPVSQGYASAATDAGLTLNHTINPSSGLWLLNKDNTTNQELFENFSKRSMHDLAVLGKEAVKKFYGKKARHSYYSGCSTGGRQGYAAAQYYPKDFDGILAVAPAYFSPRMTPGLFWPSVVLGNIVAPPRCVFEAYEADINAFCDPIDGAVDRLVGDPDNCRYDPTRLVGTSLSCSQTGGEITINKDHARVVEKILEGARGTNGDFLWYGLAPGAAFNGMANTKVTENGTVAVPFDAAEIMIKYQIFQDPEYNTAAMTFADFERAYHRSVETSIMGSDDPDLTAFQRAGGKLVTWHGYSDQLITHESSLRMRALLEKNMGKKNVDKFQRLFFAPGAGHCSGGLGPVPVDPLQSVVTWVEKGAAPRTLFASTTSGPGGAKVTRNLCPWPQALVYKGGDVNSANSFKCK